MQQNPNLTNYSAVLARKHGAIGTPEREEFDNRARTYYMGILLQGARKEEHITQAELAKRAGTSKSYISRIENGLINPSVGTFFRIINALGMRVDVVHTIQ